MPLPAGFVNELKSRLSLEETISRYVDLKRAGSNMVGCCPFHSEKTPSFTVFSKTDSFYCFGCGAGGDLISFVMKMENLDYMAAIEKLAAEAGLPIPESVRPGEKQLDRNRFYEMNRSAAKYFYSKLISPEGKPGLEYLTQTRSLSPATIKKFGLGYAPESWDGLCGHLMSEGYTASEIKQGFLAGESQKTGKIYDYFRGRVIFPIIDISGRVIAFGGRILGDGKPKYLNSSDTPVFKKSRNLYALNIAKDSASDSLILCEGYMDVIALQAAGFTNAVATLGTALTEEQVRIIKRYASTVYLCYDSDEAGQKATRRAISLLGEADLKIRVLSFSRTDAKDPDEFIKKFGKEAFRKVIDSADGQIEYVFNETMKKYQLSAPEDRLAFAKDIIRTLSGGYSSLEREIYLSKLSEMTSLPSDVLHHELDRAIKANRKNARSKQLDEDMKKASGYGDRVNPDRSRFLFAASKEENVLGILMLRPEYLGNEALRERLSNAGFRCESTKKALDAILLISKDSQEFEIGELSEYLTPDEIGALTKMMLSRKDLTDNSEAVLNALLDSLAEAAELDRVRESETSLDDYINRIKSKKQERKSYGKN